MISINVQVNYSEVHFSNNFVTQKYNILIFMFCINIYLLLDDNIENRLQTENGSLPDLKAGTHIAN